MLFYDPFTFQDESALRPPGRGLGLTDYNAPAEVHGLVAIDRPFVKCCFPKNVSVPGLFSRLELEDDDDTQATLEFLIDQFTSAFDSASFRFQLEWTAGGNCNFLSDIVFHLDYGRCNARLS
jgi:hypothetical protein